ncbi:MAG: hypothetical protein GF383_15290, partial [Candidatus Lokiarchaeota archaeon]|nr:hypothetical protein [Candidatus Lokiarchaeota archaeon]MBD3342888.1 hypothetical protein [Candidatus Lokiarchaeota archaeon]
MKADMNMNDESFRHKKDKYYKKAKRSRYRARSAYKLIDIQKKFNIFKRAFYILDVGSAPGSWLQVIQEYAEENLEKYNDQYYHRDQYKILGVDLKRVSNIENVKTIKMDATKSEFKQEIESFFGDPLDLIVSDASINKSGNKFSDQARQIKLCRKILEFLPYLKNGGIFVVKCFQGQDIKFFRRDLNKNFRYVRSYKPRS